MNLNNWRNWGTNLMIRFGFRDQFAQAFAEQDYFVEDTEEEVSLAPTFFELRIGKNWYKPWKWGGGGSKRSSPPAVDVEKIKREAVAEAKKAADVVAAKNKAAYDKQQAEITAMKDAETARQAQRQSKLTSSASALTIGGPRSTTSAKGKKEKRKMGTGKTTKPLDKPTLLNPVAGAPGQGGYSGGVPVL
jgi:hypothetical protein